MKKRHKYVVKFLWLLWQIRIMYETVACMHSCVYVWCVYLLFNHELMTLHHELKFVPFGSQGADGVQSSTRHRAQQPVLLLRLLELRQDLHTTSHSIYTTLYLYMLPCHIYIHRCEPKVLIETLNSKQILNFKFTHP